MLELPTRLVATMCMLLNGIFAIFSQMVFYPITFQLENHRLIVVGGKGGYLHEVYLYLI